MNTKINIFEQLRHLAKPAIKLSNKSESISLEVDHKKIVLDNTAGVWPPYATGQMMAVSIMPMYTNSIKDMITVDVGTGSGLFAIAASKLGASVSIATDLNDKALRLTNHNWNLNKCSGQLVTSLGDGLDAIPSKYRGKVNFMISNPPVQPFLLTKGETERYDEYAWNEAGNSGRSVLDSLLINGPLFLTSNGKLITATSTRHGWNKTTQMLDALVRSASIRRWKVIHNEEHALAPFYTKYIDTWLELDKNDGEIRIWERDDNWYHRFIVLEITK